MLTDNDEQRQYYRLQYPPPIRPTIFIKAMRYLITEISEEGIRFIVMPLTTFHVGQHVKGSIVMVHDVIKPVEGIVLPVEGTVLRFTSDNEVVLHLSQGIPLSVMIQEQQRCRNTKEAFR
jgi:hypothetical protein